MDENACYSNILNGGGIPVSLMRNKLCILHADDDWTGVSNPEERKKRQNRLNQRNHRLRRALVTSTATATPGEQLAVIESTDPRLRFEFIIARFSQIFTDGDKHQRLLSITDLGSPSLPADALLTLTRHNIYRALLHNVFSLGLDPEEMKLDIPSPFTLHGPTLLPTSQSRENEALIPSLRPTDLQRSIPHHPYIDVLPIASVRDRMLLCQDVIDDVELCLDIFGMGPLSEHGKTGLVIWGEPWDENAWEVSEEFASKWAVLISGELVRSSNYWRAQRAEEPLVFLGEEFDKVGR